MVGQEVAIVITADSRPISRRPLLHSATGVAACALALWVWASLGRSGVSAAPPPVGAAPRPDIVVFMLDDDVPGRARFLNGSPAGPHLLPALRSHGIHHVAFPRIYSTTPLCVPSRSSFLTGQYAHHHGVFFNNETPLAAQNGGAEGFTQRGLDQSTLATWLHDAGYRTMQFGKYFNNYDLVTNRPAGFVPPGWDDWRAIYRGGNGGYWNFTLSEDGTLRRYPHSSDADYGTDVLRDKAVERIAATPLEQPLFMYFAPVAPHMPAVPAPRHQGLRPTLVAPRPPSNPSYLEEDVSDKHAYLQSIALPPPEYRVLATDGLYRDGANCLASVAEAFIAVIDALQAGGRLDRTVFLFTNDNGYSFFDHRLRGKRHPYESAVRIYLAVATANAQLIPANRVEDSLVANIDLTKTIAALARAPIPGGHAVDGRSLVPLIRSAGAPPVRTDLLLESFGPEPPFDPERPSDFPAWRAVVTGPGHAFPRFKYVDYLDGHVELYDLAADPFEMTSVAQVPAYQATRAALAARLADLLDQ